MAKKMKLWEIDAWCEEVKKEVLNRVRLFTIDVLTTTVRFSPEVNVAPYAKGHFIANWNVAYTKVRSTTSMTMNAAQKIAEIESKITLDYFNKYSSVHMTNNLDYADKVENKGWVRTEAYAPIARTAALIRAKYV